MLTSRSILILAQTLLICGGISLVPASVKLFNRAVTQGMPAWWIAVIVPLAIIAGWAKARFVMRKRMVLNVRRLKSITGRIWPWQIYPPQLLVFIVAMIVLMNILKRVLATNATGLGVLGGVDVTVAVALLTASSVYRSPEARA